MVTERTTKQIMKDFNEKAIVKGMSFEEYKTEVNQVWVLKEDYDKLNNAFIEYMKHVVHMYDSPPDVSGSRVTSVLKKDTEATPIREFGKGSSPSSTVESAGKPSASEEDIHTHNFINCKAKVCVQRRKEWRARGV